MTRKYEKVKVLLPAVIEQMQAEGKTQKEIARELGLKSERVVKDLLYRSRAGNSDSEAAREKTSQDTSRVQV